MKNLYQKIKLSSLIERFGLRNMKIATITLTTVLAILFVVSIVLAVIYQINSNEYTNITM